jgi:3-carboxy-cis,cis-muconate cycloisomerase
MRAAFSDSAKVAAMLQAEAALARAQAECGITPEALAPAIDRITPEDLDLPGIGEGTALAGVPVIAFVKMARALLPGDLAAHFHKGATTQDILDTAQVLQMALGLAALRSDLATTVGGLERLAREHLRTPCIGRTYGQHAAPVTFGFKAAIWRRGILDVTERLPAVRARVLLASLGGPVGTLASLGQDGPRVAAGYARHLGLGAAPVTWHTRRAGVVEMGCWLAMLIGALAKFATDVAHLASTEVGEVAEPFTPGRGGSSAMPHKRNPVSATVILATHGAAPGHLAALVSAMAAAHERPAGAWHAEWHALPQLFGLASGALREAARLADGLLVDAGRMAENLAMTRGLIFADAAVACLSAHVGREAAEAAVARAAEAVRAGRIDLLHALKGDRALPESVRAELDGAFEIGPAVDAAALWAELGLRGDHGEPDAAPGA